LRTQKTVNGVNYNYVYEDGKLIYEQKEGEYELIYRYDADGNLFAVSRYRYSDGRSDILYAVNNTRGDVMELRAGSGEINSRYKYDSWGKLVSVTNANGAALGPTTYSGQNSIRYRGYVYDVETGLYYLQSRYYDPETGRFLNADIDNIINSSFLDVKLQKLASISETRNIIMSTSAYSFARFSIPKENLTCMAFLMLLTELLEINNLPQTYLNGGMYSWTIDRYYTESENAINLVHFFSEYNYYDANKQKNIKEIYEFAFLYGTKASWNSYFSSMYKDIDFFDFLPYILTIVGVVVDILVGLKVISGAAIIGGSLTGTGILLDGISIGSAWFNYRFQSYIEEYGKDLKNDDIIPFLLKVVLKTYSSKQVKEKVIFDF